MSVYTCVRECTRTAVVCDLYDHRLRFRRKEGRDRSVCVLESDIEALAAR